MKTTNEKVYRCDFCNKAMVSAGFMKVHEKMCKKNPENKHKCFQYCKHLQKDKENVSNYYGDEEFITQKTIFVCLMKHIELKSYKVKRNKYLLEDTKDIEFMPIKCDLYEPAAGHDFRDPLDFLDDYSEWNL